ncbi:hypothetical protein GQ44DRAFT_670649 [Phaeosphaeriaceae sp. PMI808]|nr:hypothetical protein GQ44DRAFT_670649 [Phaeosphaeriaceae sp. PMI808]
MNHSEYIRRTLVNCALDNALTTGIFRQIANAKLASSAPLQRVELTVINAGVIVSNEALAVEHNSNQYACKQYEDRGEQPPLLGDIEAAFRSIWPNKTGSDWRDDWKGLPLEG